MQPAQRAFALAARGGGLPADALSAAGVPARGALAACWQQARGAADALLQGPEHAAAEPLTASNSSGSSGSASGSDGSNKPRQQRQMRRSADSWRPGGSSSGADDAPASAAAARHAARDAKLQAAGLWVPQPLFKQLPKRQQDRILQQQQHLLRLQHAPAANMAALVINPHQLQVAVCAVQQPQAQQPRRAAAATGDGAAPRAFSTAGSDSSSGSPAEPSAAAAAAVGGGAGAGTPASSEPSRGHGRRQRGSAVAAAAAAGAQPSLARPLLTDEDLMLRGNNSQLMINLNTQMRNAAASGQHIEVVTLFHDVLRQGLAELQAAQRQPGTRQQQQPSQPQPQQQQQDGQLDEHSPAGDSSSSSSSSSASSSSAVPRLAPQFRPDLDALATYVKSLERVAERTAEQLAAAQRQRQQRGGWRRLEPEQEQGGIKQQLVWGAEHAAALWGGRGLTQHPGRLVHAALLAAYRAEGQPAKAVAYARELMDSQLNNPTALAKHSRLLLSALAAALQAGDLQAADEWARLYSSGVVPFTADDYKMRLAALFRRLTELAAREQAWDSAIYWLQQLIDRDVLVSVTAYSFLTVLHAAAAAGRMDVARVIFTSLDDQLRLQGREPWTHTEPALCQLMHGAGKAGDVAFIDLVWQRLCADSAKRSAGSGAHSDATLGVEDEQAVAAAAAAADDGDGADSAAEHAGAEAGEPGSGEAGDAGASADAAAAPGAPMPNSFLSAIASYVACEAYGKALEHVALLEAAYPGSQATSVYAGLRFFPEALRTEAQLAAAFAQLQARQDAGAPVSARHMNIITRAVARLGSTEAAGKVFESYGAWGLAPDADTYNAVMESCEPAGKVAAVEGLLSYMASKGVAPNAASWNLLLSTAVRAGDAKAVSSALVRLSGAGVKPSLGLVERAVDVAVSKQDARLRSQLAQVVAGMHLPPWRITRKLAEARDKVPLPVTRERWQPRGGGRGGSGGSGSSDGSSSSDRASSRRAVDVWRPGMPAHPAAGSGGAGSDASSSGSNGGAGSSGRVGGLRAVLQGGS